MAYSINNTIAELTEARERIERNFTEASKDEKETGLKDLEAIKQLINQKGG